MNAGTVVTCKSYPAVTTLFPVSTNILATITSACLIAFEIYFQCSLLV